MNKTSSIILLFIGITLLPIGILAENIYIKYSILFTSIVINIFAVVRSFREKNK